MIVDFPIYKSICDLFKYNQSRSKNSASRSEKCGDESVSASTDLTLTDAVSSFSVLKHTCQKTHVIVEKMFLCFRTLKLGCSGPSAGLQRGSLNPF